MRRLYSTFAGGVTGIGLLLMRLVVGSVLFGHTGSHLWSDPAMHCLCMLAHRTPRRALDAVADVVAVIQISEVLGVDGHRQVGLLVGTIAAALAMLGPGGCSVDAWLFGWRRIDAPARKK